MNQKNASIFLALFLNIIFSFLFLGGFYLLTDNVSATLYMNQIGIYANETNAKESEQKIESLGMEAYIYPLDDLYVVVTSVYEQLDQVQKEGEILTQNQITYIQKEVALSSSTFLEALAEKDMEKIMELMKN